MLLSPQNNFNLILLMVISDLPSNQINIMLILLNLCYFVADKISNLIRLLIHNNMVS